VQVADDEQTDYRELMVGPMALTLGHEWQHIQRELMVMHLPPLLKAALLLKQSCHHSKIAALIMMNLPPPILNCSNLAGYQAIVLWLQRQRSSMLDAGTVEEST
jgi:hypothetical protein